MYFKFYNVIQFNTEHDYSDIIYGNNVTSEVVYYPEPGSNAITMKSLLDETFLKLDNVIDRGAILRVNFYYSCQINS